MTVHWCKEAYFYDVSPYLMREIVGFASHFFLRPCLVFLWEDPVNVKVRFQSLGILLHTLDLTLFLFCNNKCIKSCYQSLFGLLRVYLVHLY